MFANPHGATLALERRAAVLEAVRAAGAFLIEDDAFRDLALCAPPRRRRCSARTPTATSSTSARSPSRRRPGCGSRRDRARPGAARLRAARIVEDLFVAGPLQEAALELVGTPGLARAPAAAARACCASAATRSPRRSARVRRVALAGRRDEPVGPAATGSDDRELAQRAAAAGVIVSPGRPFFAAEPPGPFLRLTFASEPPERLAEGARRLAELRDGYANSASRGCQGDRFAAAFG